MARTGWQERGRSGIAILVQALACWQRHIGSFTEGEGKALAFSEWTGSCLVVSDSVTPLYGPWTSPVEYWRIWRIPSPLRALHCPWKKAEWEKILGNDVSDKGLLSEIYRESIQIKNTRTTWLKSGKRIWIGTFPKKKFRWPAGSWKAVQHHLL